MRNISAADVAVAVSVSASSVLSALAAFTMFCWKAGAAAGALPAFPIEGGFPSQREFWLEVAVFFSLLALATGLVLKELSGFPVMGKAEPETPMTDTAQPAQSLN